MPSSTTEGSRKSRKQNKPANPPKSGAQTAATPKLFKSYFNNHVKVSRKAFKDQKERPVATLLTCSVIGIALVLPTILFVILSNFENADFEWQGSAQITLFLNASTSEEARELSDQISSRSDVLSSEFLDKDRALKEFEERFQLSDVISALDTNPLPHTIIVVPALHLKKIDEIDQLRLQLEKLKRVESSLLDALWIKRLQSITSFLEKSVFVLAIMLAIAVLLILGNTIRLAIENRKDEIAVLKLVGGTNSFVRRPFLYLGIIYGIGGSIIAIFLTHLLVAILGQPVSELAQSYQSDFSLSGLGLGSTLLLAICGLSLGWLGAWLAVRRHIDEIEPD